MASCNLTQNTPTTPTNPTQTGNTQSDRVAPEKKPIEKTDTTTPATAKLSTLSDDFVFTIGSGSHTLQIFSDFECPACIYSKTAVFPLFEAYAKAGKLKIEYRQFPLTNMHKNAYNDALAFYCVADKKGKTYDYATALYALEKKKVSAKVTDAERIEIAKKYDADITDCLKGRASKKLVDRDMKIGDDLRLTGTPSYVLDGKKLDMGVFKKEEDFTKFFDRVLAE